MTKQENRDSNLIVWADTSHLSTICMSIKGRIRKLSLSQQCWLFEKKLEIAIAQRLTKPQFDFQF